MILKNKLKFITFFPLKIATPFFPCFKCFLPILNRFLFRSNFIFLSPIITGKL